MAIDVMLPYYGDVGHFKKAGTTPKRKMHEFKEFEEELALGSEIAVDLFEEGGFVTVTGHSKGKGFQGVVKRHHFAGIMPVSYTHLTLPTKRIV